MLDEMAKVGDERIVSWQPDGMSFRVHMPDLFARTVMPHYFKQTIYKSFLRQVHLYGFHRIRGGTDTGAYCHIMFIRNKTSISLQMSCQRIKGKKPSSLVRHRAAVKTDFYSSTTNVDNYQNQNGGNLTTVLATFKEEMKREHSSKRGPTSPPFTSTGSSDHYPDEEELLMLNGAPFCNPSVRGGPSPSQQLSGISEIGLKNVDWMIQASEAQTIISRDEGLASPDHVHESSVFGRQASAVLRVANHPKQSRDEGFFAGKRFFCVPETKSPPMMVEDFSSACININRKTPMVYESIIST
jgi:hypothetical protein